MQSAVQTKNNKASGGICFSRQDKAVAWLGPAAYWRYVRSPRRDTNAVFHRSCTFGAVRPPGNRFRNCYGRTNSKESSGICFSREDKAVTWLGPAAYWKYVRSPRRGTNAVFHRSCTFGAVRPPENKFRSGYWADVVSTNDYYPFGMGMVERGDDGSYRYGFNGMQRDDEWQGAGNAYDFGARMYDGRLGRWMSVDPAEESFPFIANYTYAKDNPILRIDPNGKWDITIHAFTDRSKYGYGIAILRNRHGQEIARYVVRLEGQHHNRLATNGDTPLGIYEIDRGYTWQTGGSTVSYGPNPRLRLEGNHQGEISISGRRYIRLHGGRQARNDFKPEPGEPLQKTQGCVRMYDDDIAELKRLTEELEANDSQEQPGVVTITDDLQSFKDRYFSPEDISVIETEIYSRTNVTGGLLEAVSREEMLNVLSSNVEFFHDGVGAALDCHYEKGINVDKKDYDD